MKWKEEEIRIKSEGEEEKKEVEKEAKDKWRDKRREERTWRVKNWGTKKKLNESRMAA